MTPTQQKSTTPTAPVSPKSLGLLLLVTGLAAACGAQLAAGLDWAATISRLKIGLYAGSGAEDTTTDAVTPFPSAEGLLPSLPFGEDAALIGLPLLLCVLGLGLLCGGASLTAGGLRATVVRASVVRAVLMLGAAGILGGVTWAVGTTPPKNPAQGTFLYDDAGTWTYRPPHPHLPDTLTPASVLILSGALLMLLAASTALGAWWAHWPGATTTTLGLRWWDYVLGVVFSWQLIPLALSFVWAEYGYGPRAVESGLQVISLYVWQLSLSALTVAAIAVTLRLLAKKIKPAPSRGMIRGFILLGCFVYAATFTLPPMAMLMLLFSSQHVLSYAPDAVHPLLRLAPESLTIPGIPTVVVAPDSFWGLPFSRLTDGLVLGLAVHALYPEFGQRFLNRLIRILPLCGVAVVAAGVTFPNRLAFDGSRAANDASTSLEAMVWQLVALALLTYPLLLAVLSAARAQAAPATSSATPPLDSAAVVRAVGLALVCISTVYLLPQVVSHTSIHADAWLEVMRTSVAALVGLLVVWAVVSRLRGLGAAGESRADAHADVDANAHVDTPADAPAPADADVDSNVDVDPGSEKSPAPARTSTPATAVETAAASAASASSLWRGLPLVGAVLTVAALSAAPGVAAHATASAPSTGAAQLAVYVLAVLSGAGVGLMGARR